jgi:hypothetical protein
VELSSFSNVSENPEPPSALQSVCQLMLKARWLDSCLVERDACQELQWSPLGICRRELLGVVVDGYGLSKEPERVLSFSLRGLHPVGNEGVDVRDPSREFWLTCLEELAIPRDEDHLCALVRILGSGKSDAIMAW